MTKQQEVYLEGHPVSRGIAIGIPIVLDSFDTKAPETRLSDDALEGEITRYRRALKKSHDDIVRLKGELAREGVKDGVSVLEAHLQIIQDPLLNEQIEQEIRGTKRTAEYVFQVAIERFRKKFQALHDPFFEQRFEDVHDISKRVLAYLRDMKRMHLNEVPMNSIVFTHSLTPSEAAEVSRECVQAFVTQVGGSMSHTAIVTKAKGIPYVANVNFSKLNAMHSITMAIVDGLSGKIILNPTEKTLAQYRELKATMTMQVEELKEKVVNTRPPSSGNRAQNGIQVRLSANVELSSDFELLSQYGAEGVGLFRSEYLVLQRGYFPSEEEQFGIYKDLVMHMQGLPVVIRAFDIGVDKVVCNLKGGREVNPALGCRAIRFLLREKELFKAQIRAILRASLLGNVRILFPMISNLHELMEAKQIVHEAEAELKNEGHALLSSPKLGCMIEVPSAALIVDLLGKECDFLSIGTNDLIQYALAVDRDNQQTATCYNSTQPGVLRLLRMITSAAKNVAVPVSLCGEIASDPRFVPLLLGLGITELSVSCRFLPIIKHCVQHIKKEYAEALTEQIFAMKSAKEIYETLAHEYLKNMAVAMRGKAMPTNTQYDFTMY